MAGGTWLIIFSGFFMCAPNQSGHQKGSHGRTDHGAPLGRIFEFSAEIGQQALCI